MRRQRKEKVRSQGLRIEDAKKARINRMQNEMEDKIRTITVGEEVFYTLDEELEGEEGHDEEWDCVEGQICRSYGLMALKMRSLIRSLRSTLTTLLTRWS